MEVYRQELNCYLDCLQPRPIFNIHIFLCLVQSLRNLRIFIIINNMNSYIYIFIIIFLKLNVTYMCRDGSERQAMM